MTSGVKRRRWERMGAGEGSEGFGCASEGRENEVRNEFRAVRGRRRPQESRRAKTKGATGSGWKGARGIRGPGKGAGGAEKTKG